jgi:hypothetical protein
LKQRIIKQGSWIAEIEDVYPMSEIEKGMVFSYMKYAGKEFTMINLFIPSIIKILIFELLKALTLLIAKHEILGPVLTWMNGRTGSGYKNRN